MAIGITYLGSVVGQLKQYTKFSKIWIDNFVFRLHCKVTALILFTCCVLVSVGQFFGDPIDCMVDEIPSGVMDTYCWIHSTFSIPRLLVNDTSAHPGVGPEYIAAELEYEVERVEHKFYQWVCFTLFFQGCCFLAPYMLWKAWEQGKLKRLIPYDSLKHNVSDERMPGFPTEVSLLDPKKVTVEVGKMKDYFLTKCVFTNRGSKYYFYKFTICEVLNFFNVLFQVIFLDVFFQGAFTKYGSDVLAMTQSDPDMRDDPLNRVFPKVTKCSFQKYGPSGTMEKFDGLCILPLNIINEKIYVLLWFWFVFLITISAIQLIWRILSIISSGTREFILRGNTNMLASQDDVHECCARLSIGDWFILVQIGNNIDPHITADLIHQIALGFRKCYPDQEGEALTEL